MSDEPALASEPAEPVEEEFRVTAPTKVFDTEPGKTFKRTLEPVQRARLIGSGAIEKVGGQPVEPDHDAEVKAQAEIAAQIGDPVEARTPRPTQHINPPASPSGPTQSKE